MCTDPKIFNGVETSCRECDECAATYKNTWVSRCVAEKQTMPYAYAVTLTYADVDGEPPLGARVYRYLDVQLMWKRIRSAAKRKWGETLEMRYVIVGEKGSRYGRCHYHGVIFASHPIVELGKITSRYGDKFAYKRRLNWSLWGHGFVEFQRADRKGMAYCLKYILKARMTSARSTGYGREGKTEWLASSYLWCSKRPPIGAEWLQIKLNDLVSLGLCPPSLRMRVPGGGDWYVSGEAQREMCLFLHFANQKYREERGRDLAGWSTLVESVSDEIENLETGEIVNRKPWEWLINGEEEEQNTEITPEQSEAHFQRLKAWYEEKRRICAPITNARVTVRKCGNIIPCDTCLKAKSPEQVADFEQEYLLRFEQWREKHPKSIHESRADRERLFKEWWLTRLRPSNGCGLRYGEITQEHFRRLIPVTKAQPGLNYKGAIGKALQDEAGQPDG